MRLMIHCPAPSLRNKLSPKIISSKTPLTDKLVWANDPLIIQAIAMLRRFSANISTDISHGMATLPALTSVLTSKPTLSQVSEASKRLVFHHHLFLFFSLLQNAVVVLVPALASDSIQLVRAQLCLNC